MKAHERLAQAKEVLAMKTPWNVTRGIGEVALTDCGVFFGKDGDCMRLEEVHEIIGWLVDEFGYAPKKAKK